jgi:DNA-directed RNA polymerase specialized sigma24 family protein
MGNGAISQSAFDGFLAALHPDREKAGVEYEDLRKRIIKFFEWRVCASPEDLADETINRVMEKAAASEIGDCRSYAFGVAKFVYLESRRAEAKSEVVDENLSSGPSASPYGGEDDRRQSCLERCLDKLPPASRSMILQYYANDKQAKIDHRRRIAEQFNISINALRIKTLRIRSSLEECVLRCLENN